MVAMQAELLNTKGLVGRETQGLLRLGQGGPLAPPGKGFSIQQKGQDNIFKQK